jgi:hypothetical protein
MFDIEKARMTILSAAHELTNGVPKAFEVGRVQGTAMESGFTIDEVNEALDSLMKDDLLAEYSTVKSVITRQGIEYVEALRRE